MGHVGRTYGVYHMQHINIIEPMISSSLMSTTGEGRSTSLAQKSIAEHNVVNHNYEYHDSNCESTNALLVILVITRMARGHKDF